MAQIEWGKQKPKLKRSLFLGLLFVIVFITSSSIVFFYPYASKEKEAYFDGENPILFAGKQAGNAMIEEDMIYLPVSFLQENIDESILFDEQSNSLIIATENKVVQIPADSLTYFVNAKAGTLPYPILQEKNNELHLALKLLLDYYPIKHSVLPDSNAIWIKQDGQRIVHGEVIKKDIHEEKLRLRTDASLRTPYTAQVVPGEKLFIEGEKEDYYFVRKEDGNAGYLNKAFAAKNSTEKITVPREKEEVMPTKINRPIGLTWEAVYKKNPDTSKIPKMPGVNVISPTWFELGKGDGSIKNLGSVEFVKWAQKQDYQVWGLFSNAFDPVLTHEAFNDFETRQKMIRQLLQFSKRYQLDGINLDFENVYPEDGPLITQFVREAVPYFHNARLTVSMDITFIAGGSGNWSAFYERDKLADLVDYMIVMAYDEHWATSPVAGSVASLPWVEENLKKLLEVVPNERLILGVPLYTRLWKEEDSGKVSSKALSMGEVKEWLAEHKLKPVYHEPSGQNYAEFYSEKDQATYKIWLEDELSLQKRANLVQKYQLAGIASWSRYFADDTAWTALNLDNKQVTKK